MKRAALLIRKKSFLLLLIFLTLQSSTAFSALLVTTDNVSGFGYGMVTTRFSDIPITIPSAATIQNVKVRVANSGTYPIAGANLAIYSGTSSSPTTLIGTFTNGGLVDPILTFTGNISLPSAGTYWLRFGASAYYQPQFSMSTVTTGSVSGWSVGRMRESTDSGSTFTTRGDNLTFLFVINGTGGGLVSASTIAMSAPTTATFRVASFITATMGEVGSDGKVTFYANKKKIQGCISIPSSSLSATCSWRPATRGNIALSAKVVPNDSNVTASTSAPIQVKVSNRSTRR
jgi:hypothetical protein